eukprot:scpid12124/ scgid9400/ 
MTSNVDTDGLIGETRPNLGSNTSAFKLDASLLNVIELCLLLQVSDLASPVTVPRVETASTLFASEEIVALKFFDETLVLRFIILSLARVHHWPQLSLITFQQPYTIQT